MKRYIKSQYIQAMSMSRSSAIDALSSQSKNLREHMWYVDIARFIVQFFKKYIDESKEELTFQEIESMFDSKFLS